MAENTIAEAPATDTPATPPPEQPRKAPPPARRAVPAAVRRVVAPPPAAVAAAPVGPFLITSGRVQMGQRVEVFGPGGIGKSTLASLIPGSVFLDLEDGTRFMDVRRIGADVLSSWAALRACIQGPTLNDARAIVIDSVTKAEELAVAHTLATVPHEKGHFVDSVEGYGFGKGYQHIYETFLHLLVDLDHHVRAGRHVILIAHDCVSDVPNPTGDDFIRFEPHLQQPKSGKASIRERVFQWADHVLFIGYDVATKDGKGVGGSTRTIWPIEQPSHRAKSRSLNEPIVYTKPDDGTIWKMIFEEEGQANG